MKTPLLNAPHHDKYNKLFSSLYNFWIRKRLDVFTHHYWKKFQ